MRKLFDMRFWLVASFHHTTSHPNFVHICFSFFSLPGSWEEQAPIAYPLFTPRTDPFLAVVSLSHLITQPIILGNKVFLFLSNHFFQVTIPLSVQSGLVSLHHLIYASGMCTDLKQILEKYYSVIHTHTPKTVIINFYLSRINRNIFASTFLLYYVLDFPPHQHRCHRSRQNP